MRTRMRQVLVGVGASLVLMAAPLAATAHANSGWNFVKHDGSHLTLNGRPFRFSGANIEWLGLVGYGPLNFESGQTERFPTDYEINDALATAKEMGATVVRAQTLGDTAGCPNCLEPTLGRWNPAAFRVMDYAIMRARHYGIRLILEFQGDSRAVNGGNTSSIFSDWAGGASFWTSSTVIGDFEADIKHIIDHVNSYTGVPYKNDPTILGWMDCNGCQLDGATDSWTTTIADYIKSLDPNHLEISNEPILAPGPALLNDPNIDAIANEIYPHWVPEADGDRVTGLDPAVHAAAALTAAAGKAWFASEYGWDSTDWVTTGALKTFLTGLRQDPNVSGDLFWALEGHATGHGFTPIPADSNCEPGSSDDSAPSGIPPVGNVGCQTEEDGSWWALYYTGITTASNSATDMAQRAQIIRSEAYAMRGLPVPPHMVPPRPIITQTTGGTLYWEGSAGAKDYSIQAASTAKGPWTTRCDKCRTDLSNGWSEAASTSGGCYRVVPYNLGGVAGHASKPAGPACGPISGQSTSGGGNSSSSGSSTPCTPPLPSVPSVPTSGLAADFDNIAISDKCDGVGSFDGIGDSYSAEALAAAGITPGGTVRWGGFSFTWPDVSPGIPDNVIAAGQPIALSPPKGMTELGLLGSASFGPTAGTATINYTGGTSQKALLSFSDWGLDSGADSPIGDQVVASLPSRNTADGSSSTETYLFGVDIPLEPGKTVSSITLPADVVGEGPDAIAEIHIFSLAFSTQSSTGATGSSTPAAGKATGKTR